MLSKFTRRRSVLTALLLTVGVSGAGAAVGLVGSASGATGAASGTTTAAPVTTVAGTPGVDSGTVTAPMTASSYTGETADIKGKVTFLLSNGRTITVSAATAKKIGAARKIEGHTAIPRMTATAMRNKEDRVAVHPADTVVGDCGTSFITVKKTGVTSIAYTTGFDLIPDEIGEVNTFYWNVFGTNPGDTIAAGYTWSEGYDSPIWTSQKITSSAGAGLYTRDVSVTSNVVGSADVCYSGGPTGYAYTNKA